MRQDELMHYGVKGMRWGHRKAQPFSIRAAGHRTAARVYGLNERTYRKSNPTLASMNKAEKTKQLKAAERAQQAANAKAQAKSIAKTQNKQAKAQRKQAIKSTYKEIKKNSTFEEKFTYNNATRRKAAKYVVDNNMSISDAKKKANKDAIRNSAIILGTYGAIHVASLYMNNRR